MHSAKCNMSLGFDERGVVMKKFIETIRVIIIPVEVVLFLLVCLAATLLSAVIEIFVVSEVLQMPELEIVGSYIPVVVVIIMEVLKLFLKFYSQRLRQAGEERKAVWYNFVGMILITFSFLCTMFYTSNALYNKQSVTKALETDKESVVKEYDKKIQQVKEDSQSELEEKLEFEWKMVESARKAYDNYEMIYTPYREYVRTKEIKDKLYREYLAAQERYDEKEKEISELQESKLDEAIAELKNECIAKQHEKEEDFKVQSAGDNKYIRNTLMFITELGGKESGEYSRDVYYFIVILLSLIVALILEIAIQSGQDFLAMNNTIMANVLETNESISQGLSKFRESFCSQLIRAMVMAGIFMIVGTCVTLINVNMVLIAFGSFFFAVSLFRNEKDIEWDKGWNILSQLCSGERIQVQAMQILITVAVFVGVTIFVMHTTEDLIPASFALTIGNVSGNLVFTKPHMA